MAQATEKDSTGMIDYTEFCEIMQVGWWIDIRTVVVTIWVRVLGYSIGGLGVFCVPFLAQAALSLRKK